MRYLLLLLNPGNQDQGRIDDIQGLIDLKVNQYCGCQQTE